MKLHKHMGLILCMICLLTVAGGCSKKEDVLVPDQIEESVTDSVESTDQAEGQEEESEAEENEEESENAEEESDSLDTESQEEESKEDAESQETEIKEEAAEAIEPTAEPTKQPDPTKEPEVTVKPTEAPKATQTPKPTKKPEAAKPTSTPTVTKAPEATKAPQPTKTPTATVPPTSTPEPTKEPVLAQASMESIYQAVKSAYAENYMPVMMLDQMTISELYKVDSSWYEEVIAEGPMMSSHVDVFLGFKAKSGCTSQIKAALTSYRDYLINESLQYPMNIEKVQNALVYQNGDYVFFLMLGGYREDVAVSEYNQLAVQTINSVIAGK